MSYIHSSQVQAVIQRLPRELLRDLRSDHAGETGAVWIYKGILAVSRDPNVRQFAEHHIETEARHLAFFQRELPRRWQTRLAPLWMLSGWLLGALPALFGSRAVFLTIDAVESFVDEHYKEQLEALEAIPHSDALRAKLSEFRGDEIDHRDDARVRHQNEPSGTLASVWSAVVGKGSAAGVYAARRL